MPFEFKRRDVGIAAIVLLAGYVVEHKLPIFVDVLFRLPMLVRPDPPPKMVQMTDITKTRVAHFRAESLQEACSRLVGRVVDEPRTSDFTYNISR